MYYKKGCYLSLILIFSSMLPASLLAKTLTLHLLPPTDKNFRNPSEQLVIQFPFSILDNVTTQLALEIDNIDVSSLVTINDDLVIYVPASPLTPGFHQLRMVEYASSGDIVELGNWQFEIRQSASFQQQQVSFAATLNNSYLLADNHSEANSDIDKFHANGAAEVTYSARDEQHAIDFQGNVIYQKDEVNSTRGKQLDLGHYLLQVDMNENTQLNVGHHALQYSSLIYQDYNRRGISGSFSLPDINSKVQLLGARTGDLHGFSEGLGVGDSADRIHGAVFNFQPVSHNPEALTLSTSYMTGSQKSADAILGVFVEESSGNAQSLALDSYLLDQRLHLYLEAAQSDFDFDGNQNLLDSIEDSAYQFVTQYTSRPSSTGGTPWQWSITLEKSIVEPNFYTLSNQHLVSDNDLTRVSTNLSFGPWHSQFYITSARDNLDDRFASTNQTEQSGFDLTYSGVSSSKSTQLENYNHQLTFQRTQTDQDGVELDEFLLPLPANENNTHFIELFSEFTYPWGSWYYLLNHQSFEDHSIYQQDSKIKGAEWGGDLTIREQHTFTTSVRVYDTKDQQSQLTNKLQAFQFGIISNFESTAMTSSLTVDYEYLNDELFEYGSLESEKISANASLAKQYYQPSGSSPGMDLQFRVSYFDQNSSLLLDEDGHFYEIFADLNIYWESHQPLRQVSN